MTPEQSMTELEMHSTFRAFGKHLFKEHDSDAYLITDDEYEPVSLMLTRDEVILAIEAIKYSPESFTRAFTKPRRLR